MTAKRLAHLTPTDDEPAGVASHHAVDRLKRYLIHRKVDASFVAPGAPMPTVPLAAAAIGVPEDQILKSLLFVDSTGEAVLVIANGAHRVDRARLATETSMTRPRLADAETVLRLTGFPAGGVAPIAHATAIAVIVDQRVAALEMAYAGGGSEELLLRIRPADILRLTGGRIANIVKDDGS